jgi:hypothetical protein
MKISRWLGGLLLCAGLCSCTPQADFYVAVNGDDAHPGTKDLPFATVARARDAIRQLKKAEPQRAKPIVVALGGGTYFLKEPLVFTPEDSGTTVAPTVFAADPSDEVILSGGVLITGWREITPGRWEAQLPEVAAGQWNFSQLYVNDQRRPRPVLPKEGYFSIAGQVPPTHGENPDRFRYREGEFRADWHNLGDIEITTFHLWTMDRLRIKDVDAAQRVVTFTGPTHSHEQAPLSRATWYRIENVREALTQPGEWYLDRSTGVLTVLTMPGEDLRKARVIAPRLQQVVRFEGRKDAPVQNITLAGLTLAHNAWNTPERGYGFPQADVVLNGLLTAHYAQHCTLTHCIVRHTATWAVDWSDGCKDDWVSDCELFDLGIGGVKIGPYQLGQETDTNKWASDCHVDNSLIAHGGRVLPAGIGIWIGHAGHNHIMRNEISDFYYSGMSIGWRWGAGFSPAHHNRVMNNHIYNIGQGVLSDMAGIYTLGESPGTVLAGNRIHDVSRARYGGWGIYFDEGSANIVVSKNLVYRTQDAGLHQHYGTDNVVRNNIFAFGTNGQMRLSNPKKSGIITIAQNIFFFQTNKLFEVEQPIEKINLSSNLYWQVGGSPIKFSKDETFADWQKREPGAIVADPLFVAPERNDFRLKAGSPASRTGFVAFDASQAGRTSKSARTAKLPPVLRVFPAAPPEVNLYKNLVIDDDFESYAPGQKLNEFHTQLSAGDGLAVTASTAAGGQQSLNFRKGPPGQYSWTPHIYTKVRYEDGLVRGSFDLRHEPGVQLNHEWRDWPMSDGKGYQAGPSLYVAADGTLTASGKKLLVLPASTWAHIEILCGFGAQASGTYSVSITLPGQPPQQFDGLPLQAGFKAMDWFGFSTFGKEGSQYQLDNLKLAPVTQP